MSDIARAPSPDAAALDRQRSELVAQIEKLRQAATADRAALAQLRTQVREAARAPSPDAAALDRQRAELVAEIEKLRHDATADRTELAQLRAQVSDVARAPSPDAAALDRQRSELVAGSRNCGGRRRTIMPAWIALKSRWIALKSSLLKHFSLKSRLSLSLPQPSAYRLISFCPQMQLHESFCALRVTAIPRGHERRPLSGVCELRGSTS
ncbi:hypothetical protein NKH10_25975 [Mesorhizobium sp. M1340]|uniref:hypothetical protein n=1 Tax=Mesorhizobium sp. M1340 TaxID=2957087 RepID=UPI00333AAC0C